MGTALLALCCCALSLVLALFVGISPISDKAKIRFMYVGAALSLIAVPMMSHYIAGLNDIVDELRHQAVLVFIVVVCCYCFVMASMPVPHSSRLARSVRISPSSSVRFSKLTSLVVKDSCIRRCLGRKDSLRSEQYRLLFMTEWRCIPQAVCLMDA